jgi:predicted nucleic acid-binding protein
MPIVDSSIFVKFLTREKDWEETQKWLVKPYTVPLALKEVANALRSKTLSGELGAEDAKLMIAKLSSMVRLVDQESLVLDAFRIALDHRVTVYDAIFVAAALRLPEKELVTCDAEQARVAKSLGIKVRS